LEVVVRPISLVSVVTTLAVALAGSAGGASGQGVPLPRSQTVCMRHDGVIYSPHCVATTSSVTCNCGADPHVVAPICGKDERPAPTTPAANKARYAAAAAGHLDTAVFEGRRFCVHPTTYVQQSSGGCWPQCSLPDGYQSPYPW
jgi:hypothetical protein